LISPSTQQLRDKKMRILIADDSAVLRAQLQDILQEAGFDVAVAEDGLQAWEELHKGEIRLAVLDWLMPGIDDLRTVLSAISIFFRTQVVNLRTPSTFERCNQHRNRLITNGMRTPGFFVNVHGGKKQLRKKGDRLRLTTS